MVLLFAQRGSSTRSSLQVLGSSVVVAACVGTPRMAVGLGVVGSKLSGISRRAFQRCFDGRRSAPPVKAARPLQPVGRASNKSIDTDVLAAGFASLLSAGHFRRYTDARPAPLPSARGAPVLWASRPLWAVESSVPRPSLVPRTAARSTATVQRRQSRMPLPDQARFGAAGLKAVDSKQSRASWMLSSCRIESRREGLSMSAASRGAEAALYNKAVDADVLAAGFRLPIVRRSLLR